MTSLKSRDARRTIDGLRGDSAVLFLAAHTKRPGVASVSARTRRTSEQVVLRESFSRSARYELINSGLLGENRVEVNRFLAAGE